MSYLRHYIQAGRKTILFVVLLLALDIAAFAYLAKAATGEAHATLVPENKVGSVMAVDANSGEALRSGMIMNTKNRSRIFVDKRNLRLEFGPGSVAEIAENGAVVLYRGSVYAVSGEVRKITTANSELEFQGRSIVSYDTEEKSTSVFLVEGKGDFRNPHHPEKTLNFAGNQGTTLVSGDIYPVLLRTLDRMRADSWLAGYGWTKNQRDTFLQAASKARVPAAVNPEHAAKESDLNLAEYFPAVDEREPQPNYYENKLAQQSPQQKNKFDQEIFRNPELAASIPLPRTKIQLDLDYEVIPFQPLADKKAKALAERQEKSARRPASVKPVVREQHDQAVQNVLDRLNQIANKGTLPERGPASLPVKTEIKQNPSVIPDSVYDYSENF